MNRLLTSKGIVVTAIVLIIVGALLATLVPILNVVGAVCSIVGLVILISWAFVKGKI